MDPEVLIARALRLPDKEIKRWPFKPSVPLDFEVVFDFGPVVDRRARAFHALRELLSRELVGEYGDVDAVALTSTAYQHLIDLQASIRLLQALTQNRLETVYQGQVPPLLRVGTGNFCFGEENRFLMARPAPQPSVLVLDLRRRQSQAPKGTTPSGDSMPTHASAEPPTDPRKLH